MSSILDGDISDVDFEFGGPGNFEEDLLNPEKEDAEKIDLTKELKALSALSMETGLIEDKKDNSTFSNKSEPGKTKDEKDNSTLLKNGMGGKLDNSASSKPNPDISKTKKLELHRQKMEKFRLAEKRIGKYSKQRNLCEWELNRYNSAKAIMQDKEFVEYVRSSRDKAKLGKTPVDIKPVAKDVDMKESDGSNKEHSKRIRSEDSMDEDMYTKKSKSDLAEYMIFIVNESVQGGRVTPELWQKIEAGLTDLFLEVLEQENPAVNIQFYGAGNQSGHKYLVCCNKETVSWISDNIGKIGNLGENSKLKCFTDKAHLNQFETPKAWVWIPKPYYTESKVLRLLKAQNKEIDTASWKILKAGPTRQHGQHFLIELSKESIKGIEQLNGYLKFSVARVVVKPTRNWDIAEKVPPTDGIVPN